MDTVSTHDVNDAGWVTGGTTTGTGLAIRWQNGPLPANGATIEDVIHAAIGRLHAFQDNKNSNNDFNAEAIEHLEDALRTLDKRTKDRRERGVEGKYER